VTDLVRQALARLSASLDRLDAISLRHAEGDRMRSTLEMELAVMREDRQKLARLLDTERAERAETDATLNDMAPRIDRAMLALRQSLAEQ
jgi:Domain of unknown function (DUF4164)